jgi:hypothetical protein
MSRSTTLATVRTLAPLCAGCCLTLHLLPNTPPRASLRFACCSVCPSIGVTACVCVVLVYAARASAAEAILECVNSLLASGEVPGLYTHEELEPLLAPLKEHMGDAGFRFRTWVPAPRNCTRPRALAWHTQPHCCPWRVSSKCRAPSRRPPPPLPYPPSNAPCLSAAHGEIPSRHFTPLGCPMPAPQAVRLLRVARGGQPARGGVHGPHPPAVRGAVRKQPRAVQQVRARPHVPAPSTTRPPPHQAPLPLCPAPRSARRQPHSLAASPGALPLPPTGGCSLAASPVAADWGLCSVHGAPHPLPPRQVHGAVVRRVAQGLHAGPAAAHAPQADGDGEGPQ